MTWPQRVILLTLILQISACASLRRKPGAGSYSTHKLNVTGMERSYVKYVPAGGAPRMLLVLLHGGGGSAEKMLRLAADLPQLADRHSLLLIYADGVANSWNDGRSDITQAARQKIDDIGFLRAIQSAASAEFGIRLSFAAGISNGGMMAQRVACELSDVFRGVVSVAANLSAELAPECAPASAVSVMFINGVHDEIVPYAGGDVQVLGRRRGRVLSTEDSLAFWQKHNHCTSRAEQKMTEQSYRRDYDCENAQLTLIRVENGGHAWPGGTQYLPEFVVGHATREFSASQKIVDFMLAH